MFQNLDKRVIISMNEWLKLQLKLIKEAIIEKQKTRDYIVTPGSQVLEEASPTTNCFTAPKPALPML